jgi:hypothetical protein
MKHEIAARPGAVPRSAGAALALLLLAACSSGSRRESERESATAPSATSTPDRLTTDEAVTEAPVAFGMPLPDGMRLTRYFTDAAFFAGSISIEDALAHVRKHVLARDVEMRTRRVVIPQAYIREDEHGRLFRIEISSTTGGSQIHIQDITPQPVTQGLSVEERWRRAGRNPDGTLLNPKEVY